MSENISATVVIEFDSAKRLLVFAGKCNFLHGYHHKIEATVKAKKLNDSGLVLDFYEIKSLLKGWIDENWDHNVLLNSRDKELGSAIEKITGQKIFYFENNPTAENIADYLLKKVMPELLRKHSGAVCSKIRLYDNQDAWVESAF